MLANDTGTATRRLILLVDDDDLVRRALARQLDATFDVIEVSSYDEALQALRNVTTIAAVVSDYDLGTEQSGVDVLEDARRYCPNAPRILASGSVTATFSVNIIQLGLAHAVIHKTVAIDLVGTLENCFASPLTAEQQAQPVGRLR